MKCFIGCIHTFPKVLLFLGRSLGDAGVWVGGWGDTARVACVVGAWHPRCLEGISCDPYLRVSGDALQTFLVCKWTTIKGRQIPPPRRRRRRRKGNWTVGRSWRGEVTGGEEEEGRRSAFPSQSAWMRWRNKNVHCSSSGGINSSVPVTLMTEHTEALGSADFSWSDTQCRTNTNK